MTLDEWIEIDRKRRATLNAEFTVSANTLAMMEMGNFTFLGRDYRERQQQTGIRRCIEI